MAGRLTLAEREEIFEGLVVGWSYRRIARELQRQPAASTIQREVTANGGREGYRPWRAHRRAEELAQRPRQRLLVKDPVLAARVGELLVAMSPLPAAKLLAAEGLAVCHETIYQECFAADSVLGEAWKHLARARRYRKRRRRCPPRVDPQPLGNIVLVTARRAVLPDEPGHWEGDLIVGARNRTAAVVLCERSTRLTLLGALDTRTAAEVSDVTCRLLSTVPAPLRLTLCWDQGREMTNWPQLVEALTIDMFFCHPRSPWEKPLVENTCGLLRRWLPKRTNLDIGQQRLDTIASHLNTMPRRSLQWDTAHHRYTHLVATTS